VRGGARGSAQGRGTAGLRTGKTVTKKTTAKAAKGAKSPSATKTAEATKTAKAVGKTSAAKAAKTPAVAKRAPVSRRQPESSTQTPVAVVKTAAKVTARVVEQTVKTAGAVAKNVTGGVADRVRAAAPMPALSPATPPSVTPPRGKRAAKSAPVPAAPPPPSAPVDPATLHLTAAPVLHRILTCHVPADAFARLEAMGDSLFGAGRQALQAGIHSLEQELQSETGGARTPAGGHERAHSRPLAVPAGLAAALLVTRLAQECFDGDVHVAGGWLVARGAGLPVTLPLPEGAATRRSLKAALQRLAAPEKVRSKAGAATSGARVNAPLILVPAGPQLRAMREALGVTREKVAAAAGVTPDTVGEIERDRRPTAAVRLQVAEVLCGMNPATRLGA
jgi:DNA-binding XRE family transcriptional regulator